jgi:hypothetical protein
MRRAVLFAIVLFAAPAFAAEPSRARLIEDAAQARASGDHALALEDAQKAAAIKKTSSLALFIAEELVELRRVPEAYASVEECLRLAETEPPSDNHDKVLLACRALKQDLRAKVALVEIVAPSPAPAGMRVLIQGVQRDLPRGRFPVAPGKLKVEAFADGHTPFEWSSEVRAGADVDVPLVLKRIESAPPISTEPPPKPSSIVLPVTLMGLGAAVAIGGGILYLLNDKKYDDLKTQCLTKGCPGDARDQESSIKSMDTVSALVAIGGGVIAGVGAFMLLTRRSGVRVGAGYVGYQASF